MARSIRRRDELVVAATALLVPRRRRADWRREWRAELRARQPLVEAVGDLDSSRRVPEGLWRAMVRDAWELRALGRGAGGGEPPGRARPAHSGRVGTTGSPSAGGTAPRPEAPGAPAPLVGIAHDLRYSLRSLRRAPLFTLSVIAVLALGIGANATIFALANALMLQPLPYPEPDRLVMVWETHPEFPDVDFSTSVQGLAQWERALEGQAILAGYTGLSMTLEGGDWPERLNVVDVSERFFEVLGVDPALGRALGPADHEPGRSDVVVLGHALWQGRFGADPAIVGERISLGGRPHEVVGVMGPEFWYFDPYAQGPAQALKPLVPADFEGFDRGDRIVRVIGRRHEGVSLERFQAALDSLAVGIASEYPETHEGWGLQAVPLHVEVVDDVSGNVLLLLAAVGLVLVVACFNVANLVLARAIRGRGELALRAALGAGRWRLVRLQAVETTVLGLVGGGCGLLLAHWASRVLVAISPDDLPLTQRVGVDATVVAVVLGVSLALGLLLGGFGASQSWDGGRGGVLAEGGRGGSGGRRQGRLRNTIVAAEVALSLVLLSAAGLVLNSYARLISVDPGFDPRGVLTFESLLWGHYWDPEEGEELTEAFFDRLLDGLEGLPGVVAAGGTSHLPFSGWNMTTDFHRADAPPEDLEPPSGFERLEAFSAEEGDRAQAAEGLQSAGFRRITPGYFEAMRLRILRGRDIQRRDRDGAQRVIIVNRAFVDSFMGGEEPLGQELVLVKGSSLPPDPWRIVGVVENVKHRELGERDRAVIYVPHAQDTRPALRIVLRAEGDPLALVEPVRRLGREIDPRQPLEEFVTLDELVDRSLVVPRFYATVLGFFAAAALLLASVGIAGVVAYAVHQRTREIGIRMAIGADSGRLVRWIVGRSMLWVGIGLTAGLLGSVVVGRALSGFLFQIGPTDATTLLATAATLGSVALLASWIPARRAAHVAPLEAVRSE